MIVSISHTFEDLWLVQLSAKAVALWKRLNETKDSEISKKGFEAFLRRENKFKASVYQNICCDLLKNYFIDPQKQLNLAK